MGKGTEVPPFVAAIVIVLLVAIAGFLLWRNTGRQVTGMTPDMAAKMKEGMRHSQPPPRGPMGLR